MQSQMCNKAHTSSSEDMLNVEVNLQVRNAQLDKEARELRLENESLSENVEYGRAAAANNEEVKLPVCLPWDGTHEKGKSPVTLCLP